MGACVCSACTCMHNLLLAEAIHPNEHPVRQVNKQQALWYQAAQATLHTTRYASTAVNRSTIARLEGYRQIRLIGRFLFLAVVEEFSLPRPLLKVRPMSTVRGQRTRALRRRISCTSCAHGRSSLLAAVRKCGVQPR